MNSQTLSPAQPLAHLPRCRADVITELLHDLGNRTADASGFDSHSDIFAASGGVCVSPPFIVGSEYNNTLVIKTCDNKSLRLRVS